MKDKERKMLTRLLRLVEEYDCDQKNPSSRGGENDAAIMKDPNWQEIRNYAKLIYEEITGEKA